MSKFFYDLSPNAFQVHMNHHSPYVAARLTPDNLYSLRWRHNDHDGVSNDQPHGCLLNRLFRRRSKKTSKLRVTGLCVGNSPGPVNSPHKGPVPRKMFPFDDVIMWWSDLTVPVENVRNLFSFLYPVNGRLIIIVAMELEYISAINPISLSSLIIYVYVSIWLVGQTIDWCI